MILLEKKPFLKDFTHNNNGTVTITVQCVFCTNVHMVTLAAELWDRWIASHRHPSNPTVPLVDYIGIDNADLLITGVCPTCWADIPH